MNLLIKAIENKIIDYFCVREADFGKSICVCMDKKDVKTGRIHNMQFFINFTELRYTELPVDDFINHEVEHWLNVFKTDYEHTVSTQTQPKYVSS